MHKGFYKYNDGIIYYGEYKNRERNGHGLLVFPDGTVYEGNFQDDQIFAHGLFLFPDGSYYVGEVNKNGPDGQGNFVGSSGDYLDSKTNVSEFYITNILEKSLISVKSGAQDEDSNMKPIWANGSLYSGEWLNGKMHGQGTYK